MMLSQELNQSITIALAGLKTLDVKAAAALPAKVERLRKDLAATTQRLDQAKAEWAIAEPKLSAHQAKIKHAYENEIMVLRTQVEAGWIKEESANHQLGALDATIRDKRVLLDGLVVAIAQLADRIEGKQNHDNLIARIANQAINP